MNPELRIFGMDFWQAVLSLASFYMPSVQKMGEVASEYSFHFRKIWTIISIRFFRIHNQQIQKKQENNMALS